MLCRLSALCVEFPRQVEEGNFFQLVFQRGLCVRQVMIQQRMNVSAHRTGGVGAFVKVEDIPAHAVYGGIDVVERDVFQVFGDAFTSIMPAAFRL